MNTQIERLPNGKYNLLLIDDAGDRHRVKLDELYVDPETLLTKLAAQTLTDSTPISGVKKLVSQSLVKSAFTDNTDQTGFIDITTQIPAGSIVLGWKAVTSVGFTGDTTAIVKVGKAGALGDYSAKTSGSCLAAGTVASAPVAATADVVAATTARVTVTGGADFTSIAAGATMVVTLYYLDLAA